MTVFGFTDPDTEPDGDHKAYRAAHMVFFANSPAILCVVTAVLTPREFSLPATLGLPTVHAAGAKHGVERCGITGRRRVIDYLVGALRTEVKAAFRDR